jgi:hypothetical protein
VRRVRLVDFRRRDCLGRALLFDMPQFVMQQQPALRRGQRIPVRTEYDVASKREGCRMQGRGSR